MAITSRFESRADVAVIRNYGNLVLEVRVVYDCLHEFVYLFTTDQLIVLLLDGVAGPGRHGRLLHVLPLHGARHRDVVRPGLFTCLREFVYLFVYLFTLAHHRRAHEVQVALHRDQRRPGDERGAGEVSALFTCCCLPVCLQVRRGVRRGPWRVLVLRGEGQGFGGHRLQPSPRFVYLFTRGCLLVVVYTQVVR